MEGLSGLGGGGFVAAVFAAAVADNMVLAKMLGLCPFMSLSRQVGVAAGVGFATTAALTLSALAAWPLFLLLPPQLLPLRPLALIVVVACVVQATEALCRLYAPLLHRRLGVFLPLIAANCAVLGALLLATQPATRLAEGLALAFGGGLGFALALLCFAFLRERIVTARVPPLLRGAPLAMITAGWMTLAFSAFVAV